VRKEGRKEGRWRKVKEGRKAALEVNRKEEDMAEGEQESGKSWRQKSKKGKKIYQM
jgi:hypothetical protein